MTVYITQGRYTREAIEGMVNKPEDRAEAVAARSGLVSAPCHPDCHPAVNSARLGAVLPIA